MIFRRPTVAIALCLMWISLASRPVQADLVLVLSPNSGSVTVGQTLEVEVFLQDTIGNYLKDNGSSGGGLTDFGIRGNFDPLVFQAISYDFPTGFEPPAATSNSFTPAVNSFTASADRPGSSGVFDTTNTTPPFSVSLGKVTLLAIGPSAGSQLTLSDPNPSADNFFMAGTTGVDADVFATGSPTVATFVVNPVIAAVPEPGSMSLVGLAGAGLWLVRRRRQRVKEIA